MKPFCEAEEIIKNFGDMIVSDYSQKHKPSNQ